MPEYYLWQFSNRSHFKTGIASVPHYSFSWRNINVSGADTEIIYV